MEESEILEGLEKNGGLLGISGVSNDFRFVCDAAEQGNERAKLAVEIFVNSIVRYIGMFYAELGGLDSLVFTGGIGEHSALLRKKVCQAVSHMGIFLDEEKNDSVTEGKISADFSPVAVSVIAANEELGIARKTQAYLEER